MSLVSRNRTRNCDKCFKKIFPLGVTIHGKIFHRDCFRCESCQTVLQDYSFRRRRGRVGYYCLICYAKRWRNIKCAVCLELILGDVITAYEQRYHEKCFNCHECQKFLGQDFDLYPWDDVLLCPVDFERKMREQENSEAGSSTAEMQNDDLAQKSLSIREKDEDENEKHEDKKASKASCKKSRINSVLYFLMGCCI